MSQERFNTSKNMDHTESFNAIVMPSRTIMLTGIPPELNNSDTLHSYFSKFGALLWVNEKYENDSEAAIVTFFSIGEAIAAYMCDDYILDVKSIRRRWFQYTEKCDLCSYKYSSQESIQKHIAQCHTSKDIEDDETIAEKDSNSKLQTAETNESVNGIQILISSYISFHFSLISFQSNFQFSCNGNASAINFQRL